MALAQDRVRELLQRSFTQLPVAGDLPRLCNRMQVFVREEEDTPCIFLKEGREGEKRGVEDTAHSTTQRTKQEREGKMVYCTDTPRRENLCKLLSVLSDVLEPEMKREVVHQFEQYFPPSAEVSNTLVRFLNEIFGGNDSKVVRLIKSCNQAIIAPVIIQLKTHLGVENMTKDVAKSWTTKIFVERDEILVCIYKREQQLENLFQYEWELMLTFDRKEVNCIDVKVKLTDLMFHERLHGSERQRKEEVKKLLEALCIVDSTVLGQADSKTWEFNQCSDEDGKEKKKATTMMMRKNNNKKREEGEKEDSEEERQVLGDKNAQEDTNETGSFLADSRFWGLFLASSFVVLSALVILEHRIS